MSNKTINIKQNVMDQIKKDKVSMKPRAYFMLGSILAFLGLMFSIVVSVFLFSIISFISKAHGPMAQYRLEALITSFPWWALVLGILGLFIGIYFIRKYDFSYKFNPFLLIIVFVAAVVIAGFVIDLTGFDNLWLTRGPMQGAMKRYIQQNNPNSNFGNYEGFQKNGRGERSRMNNY